MTVTEKVKKLLNLTQAIESEGNFSPQQEKGLYTFRRNKAEISDGYFDIRRKINFCCTFRTMMT
jgi:hypothetical protein